MPAKTKPKKGTKTATRRKQPVQARSQRRFEAIVEAAAESFARFGFDATTMEGIAARAETSIGSVYQFFPNKTSVFREVAQRALQTVEATFVAAMGPDPTTRAWPDLLERSIDVFFDMHRHSVAMQAIVRNLHLYREYEEQDRAQLETFRERTSALLAIWVPDLPPKKRKAVGATLVNTVASTMLVLSREPAASATMLKNEAKVMLRRYLSAYVPEPEP